MNLRTQLQAIIQGAILTLTLANRTTQPSQHACSEVTFDITTSSQNSVFASPPDPTNDTALWEFLADSFRGKLPVIIGTTTVNGTFTISGTYCVPQPNPHHKPDILQILIHGITYNKNVWAGLGLFGNHYNWHKAANDRGYATLAIDRLGNGLSSRPDPIHVAQPQLELAILNEIVLAAQGIPSRRSILPFPKTGNPLHAHTYPKVILVDHSFGSYLAPSLTTYYPSTQIAALVLTEFSTSFNISFLSSLSWAPASVADPGRFAHLSDRRGYFTQRKESEREEGWYAGGYDERVAEVDFQTRDTVAVGGFGGLAALSSPAVNYRGPVMVVAGELDGGLCERPVERCREGLERSRGFFPSVGEGGYEYLVIRDTGHDLGLHYSAGETVRRVHDWLDGNI